MTDGRRPWILIVDTATSMALIGAADRSGGLIGLTTWAAGQRHGETLLPAIGRLTGEANLRRSRIEAVVVGTGPGAFTGLRVGLATAKTIAHELDVPLVGVSTGEALLAASVAADATDGAGDPRRPVLLLPAGPSDRVFVRAGSPAIRLLAGAPLDLAVDERLVALDLADRAPDEALVAGELARGGLAAALLALALPRLAAGATDDPAVLVPEYVTPPRGVLATGPGSAEGVAWSRDPR